MNIDNMPVLVTALHGNEPVPMYALVSLGLPVVPGNLQALVYGKRFTEQDLNASFGCEGDTYEEIRAREILKEIPGDARVVDFHTFSCESPPFSIITDMKMLELAACLGIRRVVYMKHNIKAGRSLCDHRDTVAVEAGKHDAMDSFTTTQDIARRLLRQEAPGQIELYEAYDIIEAPNPAHRNFEAHEDGFVPVLAGESAYEHGGLKTRYLGTRF